MKKKAQKSTRNRHTGRVNGYKKMIIEDGRLVIFSDRQHARMATGIPPSGSTNVRI